MTWQPSTLTLLAFLTTLLTFGLSGLGWYKRNQPGSAFFAFLMFAAGAWALMLALGNAVVEPAYKIFFGKLEYPGIVSVPVLWLLFAADYTHRDRRLTRRNQLLLWIIPTLTMLLAFSNDQHRWLWSDIVPSDIPGVLVYQRGPYFWVHVTYSYVLLIIGTLMLILTARQSQGMYRTQSLAIVSGALIPWGGNLIYLLNTKLTHGLDITPIAFSLTGIIFAWSILRYRLLDLMPIARDVVVENMLDGVIVLDAQDHIVDINPSARQILGFQKPLTGTPAQHAFAQYPAIITLLQTAHESQNEIRLGTPARDFETHVSILQSQHTRMIGRVLILRDITERKMAERVLRENEDQYRQLFANAPFPILITTIDNSTILYLNQRAADLFEVKLEQALGQATPDYWGDPQTRQQVLEQLDRQGQVRDYPITLRLASGKILPVLLSANLIRFQNQRAVFASLANLTEQKKLEQAERQAREYAEALRDSTAMLTSTLDLDQVLDRILSNLAQVTAYDIANIMFIEEDVARVVRAQRHTGSSIDHSFYNNVGLSVSQSTYFARMIATHESVVIPNVATDPNWISFPETDWLKSYASAPLVINHKVIGFLNLDSSTPGFYNAEHAVRIRAFADQAAIAIQNARLFAETQRQATTDPLTGLHNRRHFTDLALGEIERARRYHHPLSLILLDIDHFKNVNDTLGHLAGDKVLQIIAEQIRASLRQTDLVGRHGGEEFIILLPETPIANAQTASLRLQKLISQTDAYSTAERLRQHIQETHVETARGTASVTASLGVAQLTESTRAPTQSITLSHPLDELEQMIARADHALYEAKANGRNQVAVCTDE